MDSELIGVALKMSVENFLETGLRKNLPELPNTTGLGLREAAKVLSNVTLARKRRKPSRGTGSQTCIPVHGHDGLLLERGSRYRKQFHELRGNN